MPDEPPQPTGLDAELADVDTDVAQPARIADYLLGGDDNFAVDRKVIEYLSDALPDGIETARAMARASGGFLQRTVRYLAGEAGIRQFLTIGTPVPSGNDNLHHVAQAITPDARVVYVIKDPVVLAHAHELRRGTTPEGATAFVHAALKEPQKLVRGAAATLDFSEPVAVLCIGRLHFVRDSDEARDLVAQLAAAVVPGSYLVLTHLANDLDIEGLAKAAERLGQLARDTMMRFVVLRSHGEVTGFFDGLELVEPGVVPINRWRPAAAAAAGDTDGDAVTAIYGGVARKP